MLEANDGVYGAIIVGGGQAGLATAGRLRALGVKYLLLERTPEIGDTWRNRYDSLRFHTTKEYGALPFDWRFPPEDDKMLPAKRIGAGHQAWAKEFGINLRTNTTVTSARYDETSETWAIVASGPQEVQTYEAKNLVLAIGPGSATPSSPEWASLEKVRESGFVGDIFHASTWKSAQPWAGKRGIVVGSANTGHDVAEDMANAGMETTIVQRSPTLVLPVEWLHAVLDRDYNVDKSTAAADREQCTYPNKIVREVTNKVVHGLVRAYPERFEALEQAGFKVDRYGDLYSYLLERFGGHYVDIGCSARIANGEIRAQSAFIRGLSRTGLVFEDGTEISADLIVLATGYNHAFRIDAARLIGPQTAAGMDEFGGLDEEGEMRGLARFSGYSHLYYHGFDARAARWYSRFIALCIQADVLGQQLKPYSK